MAEAEHNSCLRWDTPYLQIVLRKLGLFLAALALFLIAGGHWAVLQTAAWAEMLRDYTQRTGSVVAAVEQTFDGAHPCELCLRIASAKQQEAKTAGEGQKPPVEQKVKAGKSDKALVPAEFASPVWAVVSHWRAAAFSLPGGSTRAERPPTPPPRSLFFA